MIKIRKLTEKDKPKLDKMIEKIEKSLTDKKWWLPIKKTAYDNFFNLDWTVFLGAFDNDKLIAASALFLNEYEYKESVESIGMKNYKFAEIGRCMVLSEYRGYNLMYKLNIILENIAKKKVEYIIATVHPDNISSNKSLLKLGMYLKGGIVKYENYERNIYIKKL